MAKKPTKKKTVKKDKPGRGRPTKFDPSLTPQVTKFMLMGATMEQLADFLGCHISQIYRWMEKDPIFREGIFLGREGADAQVAQAMFKRAVGTRVKATKIFFTPPSAHKSRPSRKVSEDDFMNGEDDDFMSDAPEPEAEGKVTTVDYYEYYPPDVKAGIFWLTNRQSHKWKEKQTIDQNVTGEVQHNIDWVEAADCEPLKTPEEIEAEEQQLNQSDATSEDEH